MGNLHKTLAVQEKQARHYKKMSRLFLFIFFVIFLLLLTC